MRRHGFTRWEQLYPSRQRVVLERLLSFAPEATSDERVQKAVELAIVGAAEMAGHLSRWDRWYLKSYESMAGHRFNFTTFAAEPNVWGTAASGRGTVRRRLEAFAKASEWLHQRVGRDLAVEGPHHDHVAGGRLATGVDVRAAEGNSEQMLLPDDSVDLTLTDPPYHDDVQYDELSLPLRAWAGLSLKELVGEAIVNPSRRPQTGNGYRSLLTVVFQEVRRTLRADGHLIFSYANRQPAAWVALFGALDDAGLRALGFQLFHSENETDYAKRGVRACTLDLVMDLVLVTDDSVEQWWPADLPACSEGLFLSEVAETFMQVGALADGWDLRLMDRLRATEFLAG